MASFVFAVAAPKEAEAVFASLCPSAPTPTWAIWTDYSCSPDVDLLLTGVGKSAAAGAIARYLQRSPDATVVNLGIAGSLPGSAANVLDVVIGRASVMADEGLETDTAFVDIATMGFSTSPGRLESVWPADPQLLSQLTPLGSVSGGIATVSTCAGTDHRAQVVRSRTGAEAEAMEGAAIALVCELLDAPFIECRVISNRTGARARQGWNLEGALSRLGRLALEMTQTLRH